MSSSEQEPTIQPGTEECLPVERARKAIGDRLIHTEGQLTQFLGIMARQGTDLDEIKNDPDYNEMLGRAGALQELKNVLDELHPEDTTASPHMVTRAPDEQ